MSTCHRAAIGIIGANGAGKTLSLVITGHRRRPGHHPVRGRCRRAAVAQIMRLGIARSFQWRSFPSSACLAPVRGKRHRPFRSSMVSAALSRFVAAATTANAETARVDIAMATLASACVAAR
jgi:ABC-type branched-subunit amino acid transport system ATPase component